MARRKNQEVDVFRFINMHDGDNTVCWEWTGALGGRDKRPYFTVNGTKVLAYRLSYRLMHGTAIPDDKVARHKCDNKICCNPWHIEEGDHQENMNDMKERERHGLPHHTIRAIRRLLNAGRTHQEIAELYGVSRQTITAINNDERYQHVKDETNDEPSA
jgi:DNA-binding XRE family transcriptional regulator